MSTTNAIAEKTSRDLLRGAIDMHVHSSPDVFPRSVTSIEAAEQARDAGMTAIVLKSHSIDTSARAELVSSLTGQRVSGGIALNYPVGGVNPYAVLESAKQGGRVVWLPTLSARHFLQHSGTVPILNAESPLESPGIVVTDGSRVLPEVEDVLQIIKQHGLILSSGHVSPEETTIVFRRAHEIGIERLVVTHPHAPFVGADANHMRQFAALGAMHEMVYAFATPLIEQPQTMQYIATVIRSVGVEYCYVASDGGQAINPPPVEAYRLFVLGLLGQGFSVDELRYMTAEAPGKLLA